MKKIFVTASAICFLLSAKAQFTYDYLKAADDYYRKADYYSAAQYYEKYLTTNGVIKGGEFDPYVVKSSSANKPRTAVSSKEQAIYNLAESYRQLNYYVKAEPFYEQAATFDGTKFPLADYHYAATLRALGKFEEAEKAFRQFLGEYTVADKYAEAAQREIQNLQYIQAQLKRADLDQFSVSPSASFNAEGANYAPVWVSPSKLYFTTTRPDGTSSKKTYLNKVYEVSFNNGAYENAAKVTIPQPADVHQGGISLSADGNTMFLTRWTIGGGTKTASIYISRKNGHDWSEPVALNASVNAAGANSKQPFAMADGKLLFASDREGGLGGFDLYTADITAAGEATNVTNLGPVINTKYNEEAPAYHAASNTLVFATDGRVGMGGYDLFFSKQKAGTWSDPENFGYPVNSIKNDMYFASRGPANNILQDVLLSSDRAAECCMQIFAVSKAKQPKLIAGTVVDCKTNEVLANVKVEVKDASNKTVFTGNTSANGTYNFTMEEFAALQISGTLQGYKDNNTSSNAPADAAEQRTTLAVLCLDKIPDVGVAEVIDNIYFAFDKAAVLEESYTAMDKLAKMLMDNPNIHIEVSGHTDSKGDDNYNRRLSEARAQNVVNYLASKGVEKERLTAVGYGEAMPVAPNKNDDGSDNPEGREKNRRTEYKVIKK
jgi:outer membrane protein OmpA-like peptidoglycan-associated protein